MDPGEIMSRQIVAAMQNIKEESGGRYYPAWFAFPSSKIRRSASNHKTREIATVIPGDRSTYIFDNEDNYQ